MIKIVPVILSGGVGSRLWPMSREHYPKQCIPLLSEQYSLLQETVLRLNGLDVAPPVVICNENHRFLVAQQVQELGIDGATIILEPEGRNTAPAIALAALEIEQQHSNAVMLVLPADHVIDDGDVFRDAVIEAVSHAEKGALVAFGIKPTRPETGYGYIKLGADNKIEKFVEKPVESLARKYLDSGEYLWNSGMFLFQTQTFLQELKLLRLDIYSCVYDSYQERVSDLYFVRVGKAHFLSCAEESMDYAVMEVTSNAKAVPYCGGWSDIGAWDAFYEHAEKDREGNVLLGDVLTEDTKNSLVSSQARLVATVGVSNLVIVETVDAVLVMDKSQAQGVKKIVKKLKELERSEHSFHSVVHRPWGTYQTVDKGERHQVKRIIVKPGEKLSVQLHHHRAEHWVVVSGTAKVQIGQEEKILTENESIYIPLGQIHALENPGKINLHLIEVQSGGYLGEDDIVRFSDRYGREEGG